MEKYQNKRNNQTSGGDIMADNIDTKPVISQETREKYHNAEQLGRAIGTFKHIIQVGAIKDEYGYINNFINEFLDREKN